MAATKFWVFARSGVKIGFTSRKAAEEWIKDAQKQHPRAHYHIYDNDPDGYRCKMKDRKKYWR